jgi:hypothetical protein
MAKNLILPHWDLICQEAMSDINQSIEVNKLKSVRVLLFDPELVRVGDIGGPIYRISLNNVLP